MIQLDILRLEKRKVPRSAIVKDLSKKHKVTPRNVYHHLETQTRWQSAYWGVAVGEILPRQVSRTEVKTSQNVTFSEVKDKVTA